jgi:ankyrin repeat protein
MNRQNCWLLIAFLFIVSGMTPAGEKPGSVPTLIESLQQAGRQKRAAESLRYLEQAQKLLDASGMQAVDSKKRTALHWCVISAQSASNAKLKSAYSRLIEELLSAGADVNAQDWYGNTPLDYRKR